MTTKKLCFYLVSILVLAGCSKQAIKQTIENDLTLMELNGRVSQIIEITTGETDTTQFYASFDTCGMFTEQTLYANSELQLKTVYTDSLRYQIDGNNELQWIVEIDKDSNGLVTKEHSITHFREWTTFYNYNDHQQIAMQTDLDTLGQILEINQYAYNKQGLLETQTCVSSEGGISLVYNHTYNKKGQLIALSQTDSEGKVVQTYEYEYDKNGNQTLCRLKASDGRIVYSEKSKYNDTLLVEKICSGDNIYNQQFVFKYDENGILQSEEINEFDFDNEVSSIKVQTFRKCDSLGNWTEEQIKEYDSFGLPHITTRKRVINYYE